MKKGFYKNYPDENSFFKNDITISDCVSQLNVEADKLLDLYSNSFIENSIQLNVGELRDLYCYFNQNEVQEDFQTRVLDAAKIYYKNFAV